MYKLEKSVCSINRSFFFYLTETIISLIQRFEFTYELTHKTQQDFFKYSDITLEVTFPQMIFKKSYSNNLIDDEQLWIRLLEDKNAT
ncbi:HI0074 family nucleotidyltransferase substrate-binding subunit [Turicibacter sanguinis]|uniref:HI0074 family nucleotidyltransferase substrate-binding subunit n=1 Tax=Turicibacter sanguinis TaxID=154288 RepID=UPI00374D0F73